MDYKNATNKQLEQLVMQKDYKAIHEMAERCRAGSKGQEKNLTRAAKLYHKGEKQGFVWAYEALGNMYEVGEYFAQNTEIANEYYKKVPGRQEKVNGQNESVQTQMEQEKTVVSGNKSSNQTESDSVDTNQIQQYLTNGEKNRQQENTAEAKNQANQARALINQVKAGKKLTGGGDVQTLEVESCWLLAYTAFNESAWEEMSMYLEQPGVYALHPWGAYLLAMVHSSNGAPEMILEKDMQRMLDVSENPNLSMSEKGDIMGAIGDFYLRGLHSSNGDTLQLAYSYYVEAGKNGNSYADEQAGKFKTTLLGKVKYIG